MKAPRFLIDENLSIHLPAVAHARGFDAVHAAHRGLQAWNDWSLVALMEVEDRALVTNNAIDFRGLLSRRTIHPGVVFITPSVPRDVQMALFSAALDEVARDLDLVNTAIDVSVEEGAVRVRRFALP